MVRLLRTMAVRFNRKWRQRLMRLMGIAALAPTGAPASRPAGHRIFLVCGMTIDRPKRVRRGQIA
jgi:hypothetical protein